MLLETTSASLLFANKRAWYTFLIIPLDMNHHLATQLGVSEFSWYTEVKFFNTQFLKSYSYISVQNLEKQANQNLLNK